MQWSSAPHFDQVIKVGVTNLETVVLTNLLEWSSKKEKEVHSITCMLVLPKMLYLNVTIKNQCDKCRVCDIPQDRWPKISYHEQQKQR